MVDMVRRKRSNDSPFAFIPDFGVNFGNSSRSKNSKCSGNGNIFGFSSPILFGQKRSEKQRKRDQLAENQQMGLRKQRFDEMMYQMQGYDVKRRRTGCDFEATRTNLFTGRKEHIYVESKSSPTAPLRPLQKKMQKNKKGRYKVERGVSFFI